MFLLLVLVACGAGDACENVCDASLDAFSSCLEARGQSWGAEVGYEDAADYRDWCDTYVWEMRQLGADDTCETRLSLLADGGCDAHDAAWSVR